jgi:hypothetical protein
MSTRTTFDLAGLIGAIESGDTSHQLALYADCAEMQIIDPDRPVHAPQVLRGRPAIAAWIGGVYSRHEIHRVVDFTADSESLVLIEECQGPGGARFRFARSVQVSGGQITRETAVLSRVEDPRPHRQYETVMQSAGTSRMIDQDPGSTTLTPPRRSQRVSGAKGDYVPGFYLG